MALQPDGGRRRRAIFDLAMDMPRDEREAFLQRECGDDADLLESLRRMLRGADEHLLPEQPPPDAAEAPAESVLGAIWFPRIDHRFSLAPGAVIDKYIIREGIGCGGFGEVYRADRVGPVTKPVAIKVLLPGMNSREVLARFAQEQQALAQMDHPHIATFIDAGCTDQNLPYFVMEYVRGVPISRFCNQLNPSIEARLALFDQLCSAVDHAHARGMIHRDIKPGNVLIVPADPKAPRESTTAFGLVKVIDFGIAKAVTPRPTGDTVYTTIGRWMGSADYMSPEQMSGGAAIDARTDVYALGAVLYELLTGVPPLDLRERNMDEQARIVVSRNPIAPSRRLTELLRSGDTRAAATVEGTESVIRRISGPIDAIVLKSLRKNPAERYQGAAAMAEDLRRALAGEQVSALPDTSIYRLRTFMRRRRMPVAAAAAVVFALAAGLLLPRLFGGPRGLGGGAWKDPWFAQMIADTGVDPARLSAADFTIGAGTMSNSLMTPILTIETTQPIRSFAGASGLEYRVGERGWTGIMNEPTMPALCAQIGPDDLTEGGPVEIRMNPASVGRPVGGIIGPFRYEVDVKKLLLEHAKQQIGQHPAWFRGQGRHWLPDTVLFTPLMWGSAIRAIEAGASPEQLTVREQMPEGPGPGMLSYQSISARPDLMRAQNIAGMWKRLDELDAPTSIFARVEYIDGTFSPVREFTRQTPDPDEPDYTGPGYTTDRLRRDGRPAPWPTRKGHEFVSGNIAVSQLHFGGLIEVLDQVAAIFVGPSAGEIRYPVRVEPDKGTHRTRDDHDGREQVIRGQGSMNVDVPPSWRTAYIRIQRKDGVEVPVVEVPLKQVDWTTTDCPVTEPVAEGLEFVPPMVATYGGGSLEGHDTDFTLHVPFRPAGTVRMTYSIGDRGFIPWSYGRIEVDSDYLDDRDFSLDEPLRIIFQLADGREIGPVSYSLAATRAAIQSAARHKARLLRRELVACGLWADRDTGHIGGIDIRRAQAAGAGTYPFILAYMALRGMHEEVWYSIKEVHFGSTAERSEASFNVPAPAEMAVIRHNLRWTPAGQSDARDFAILPATLTQPWAWLVFHDGTRSEPFQIRCGTGDSP